VSSVLSIIWVRDSLFLVIVQLPVTCESIHRPFAFGEAGIPGFGVSCGGDPRFRRLAWRGSQVFSFGEANSRLFAFGVPHENDFLRNPPHENEFLRNPPHETQ
jgi:hypothetical protein